MLERQWLTGKKWQQMTVLLVMKIILKLAYQLVEIHWMLPQA